MSSETWRVVLSTGEVREVVVYRDDSDSPYSVSTHRWCAGGMRSRTAHGAVVSAMSLGDEPVREILAPGEPTRAEAIETARRDGAEAMREACASRFEVRASGFDDAAREWGRRSEPNLVADCERQARAARIEAATIRALPLPGEVTP